MRPGIRLGIDVGRARVGVARCDPHGMLATPLETVARSGEDGDDISRIVELCREWEAIEVIVGYPVNLRGERTPSTDDAVEFASRLAEALNDAEVHVRLIDERLSTTQAQSQLRSAGRKTKGTRSVIDQAAAVVILQHALDMERVRGEPVGERVAVCVGKSENAHGENEELGT